MEIPRPARTTAQVWVELASHDPEAVSTLAVARARLAAGEGLEGLRRARLFELTGALPTRSEIEALLHRSSQFYNPHKERCTVRLAGGDPAPVRDGERVVVVVERGGERRGAAERWWRHQTGRAIQVREGVAWVLRFAPGVDADDCASDLARVRDRGHGLLSNPHAQDARVSGADVALPCLTAPRRARRRAASEPS